MSDIELKLEGGSVVRTVNGGEPETFYYEFGFEDDDSDETEYPPDCETCGGEFWDGGTSCQCNIRGTNCRVCDCCDSCGRDECGSCEGRFFRDGSQYVCHCCNCDCDKLDW